MCKRGRKERKKRGGDGGQKFGPLSAAVEEVTQRWDVTVARMENPKMKNRNRRTSLAKAKQQRQQTTTTNNGNCNCKTKQGKETIEAVETITVFAHLTPLTPLHHIRGYQSKS